jgi:DNA-binding MarR family transcriptional regulator
MARRLTRHGLTPKEVDVLRALDSVCFDAVDGWAYAHEVASQLGISEAWATQRLEWFISARGLVERRRDDFGYRAYAPTEEVQAILDETAGCEHGR